MLYFAPSNFDSNLIIDNNRIAEAIVISSTIAFGTLGSAIFNRIQKLAIRKSPDLFEPFINYYAGMKSAMQLNGSV